MTNDLLEQFARSEIPPLPADFDRHVGERVNRALVLVHVAEFGLRVLPYAFVHMAQALTGFVTLTLSGRFPADPSTRNQ